ncbi:MAG: hypothetical protein EOP06_17685, partial [Proteobacteria bacterium]
MSIFGKMGHIDPSYIFIKLVDYVIPDTSTSAQQLQNILKMDPSQFQSAVIPAHSEAFVEYDKKGGEVKGQRAIPASLRAEHLPATDIYHRNTDDFTTRGLLYDQTYRAEDTDVNPDVARPTLAMLASDGLLKDHSQIGFDKNNGLITGFMNIKANIPEHDLLDTLLPMIVMGIVSMGVGAAVGAAFTAAELSMVTAVSDLAVVEGSGMTLAGSLGGELSSGILSSGLEMGLNSGVVSVATAQSANGFLVAGLESSFTSGMSGTLLQAGVTVAPSMSVATPSFFEAAIANVGSRLPQQFVTTALNSGISASMNGGGFDLGNVFIGAVMPTITMGINSSMQSMDAFKSFGAPVTQAISRSIGSLAGQALSGQDLNAMGALLSGSSSLVASGISPALAAQLHLDTQSSQLLAAQAGDIFSVFARQAMTDKPKMEYWDSLVAYQIAEQIANTGKVGPQAASGHATPLTNHPESAAPVMPDRTPTSSEPTAAYDSKA